MHHCFVIHKEHFAIVLYRVHELLRFRIVKESICRFVYLYLLVMMMVWCMIILANLLVDESIGKSKKRETLKITPNKMLLRHLLPNGFQSIQHMLVPLPHSILSPTAIPLSDS
ncbi:hypothetical protein L2E82_06111 [Cichorium intybus]|uniref:Uncharacterized protein n=1 Tax=Cichorium intybus TaxID=13427 RepID=A0ACB9HBB6_CICIN|nr:hypothetical protein L2E82_06111 [Cichorium intybus]